MIDTTLPANGQLREDVALPEEAAKAKAPIAVVLSGSL